MGVSMGRRPSHKYQKPLPIPYWTSSVTHAQDLSKGLVAKAREATGVALIPIQVALNLVGALKAGKKQFDHPMINAWTWVLEHKLYAY